MNQILSLIHIYGVEAMDKSKAHEARELLLRIIMEDRKKSIVK